MRKLLAKLGKPNLFITLSAVAAITIGLVIWHAPRQGIILKYTIISYDPSDSTVQVRLELTRLDPKRNIEIYKGDVKYSEMELDSRSNSDGIRENDRLFVLETKGSRSAVLTYKAKLGELGKHGRLGAVYDDLLVFEGSHVLLLPNSAFDTQEKSIYKLTVEYRVPQNWKKVIPFSTAKGCTEISDPTWKDIYTLQKCCYAFGEFEFISNASDSLKIYRDPGYELPFDAEDIEGIESLYAYFGQLMGEEWPQLQVVLLRESEDGRKIMGGAETLSVGATFSPIDKRDWELMGHRLFHAFFETNIMDITFLEAPKLWFYEGMACYYENMSMSSLPLSVRLKTGMEGNDPFLKIFRQFVYMRYKDPYLLTLTPMYEAEYQQLEGLVEFLHYTQAPLIIKAMENESFAIKGKSNTALDYIMQNRNKTEISLEDIFSYTLEAGIDEFASRYLFGNEIPPLWDLGENQSENIYDIVNELQELEYTLWTWFVIADPEYPMDRIGYENAQAALEQAERLKIYFTGSKDEELVKVLSPAIYALLKEYAYRAYICGIEYNDPMLRYELTKEENLIIWEEELRLLSSQK